MLPVCDDDSFVLEQELQPCGKLFVLTWTLERFIYEIHFSLRSIVDGRCPISLAECEAVKNRLHIIVSRRWAEHRNVWQLHLDQAIRLLQVGIDRSVVRDIWARHQHCPLYFSDAGLERRCIVLRRTESRCSVPVHDHRLPRMHLHCNSPGLYHSCHWNSSLGREGYRRDIIDLPTVW